MLIWLFAMLQGICFWKMNAFWSISSSLSKTKVRLYLILDYFHLSALFSISTLKCTYSVCFLLASINGKFEEIRPGRWFCRLWVPEWRANDGLATMLHCENRGWRHNQGTMFCRADTEEWWHWNTRFLPEIGWSTIHSFIPDIFMAPLLVHYYS